MIINKETHGFITRSDKPNENWLNDSNYYVVNDYTPLYEKILNANYDYEFVIDENNNLIDIKIIYNLEEIRASKLQQLEEYYTELMNKGLEYNGYIYDISQEAQEDRRDISDTINDAIATFGEDSEEMEDALAKVFFMPKVALPNNEGVLSFRTVAEWKQFSLAFMLQVTTNSTIYYTIKQKIELAQTEEELNNIIFE